MLLILRPYFGILTAALWSFITLLSCVDATFLYRPEGWEETSRAYEWLLQNDDLELTTRGITATSGSRSIVPEFDIRNLTDKQVILEKAELFVKGVKSPLRSTDVDRDLRLIQPGKNRNIPLYWQFDSQVLDILGQDPVIVLHFLMDTYQLRIEVSYCRVQ